MITPEDKVNAFAEHRLSKKTDTVTYDILGFYTLSATKHSIFTFVHLLNRTVSSTPWVFICGILITLIQTACAVTYPYHEPYWIKQGDMPNYVGILGIILRYIPYDANMRIQYAFFGVYGVLIIAQFLFALFVVLRVKAKKEVRHLNMMFFYISYFIVPILRGSIVGVLSTMICLMGRAPGFGNFFLSLIAVILFILFLVLDCIGQLAMGSSPSPNMANPLANWAPDTWMSVAFEITLVLYLLMIEVTRQVDGWGNGITMLVSAAGFAILFGFQIQQKYLVSYVAYEYQSGVALAVVVFHGFLAIVAFIGKTVPFYVFIVLWLGIPLVGFFIVRIYMSRRVANILAKFELCGVETEPAEEGMQATEDAPLLGDNSLAALFAPLGVKDGKGAIAVTRVGCLCSHPLFEDMSMIKYYQECYPEITFELLALANLIPRRVEFVQSLIEAYFRRYPKPSFLAQLVIFQIVAGQQESSAELPASIMKEVSAQSLQGMKCKQLLNKFWTTCFRGDVSQLARSAFLINKHIRELDRKWKMLVLRYPFSRPVLREYVLYMQTIGAQHKMAEAIIASQPQLMDAGALVVMGPDGSDINMNILWQSVEEAVDRRPVYSTGRTLVSLAVAVIIALAFLIFACTLALVSFADFDFNTNVIQDANFAEFLITHMPNLFDDLNDNIAGSRETMYLLGVAANEALTEFLADIPHKVLVAGQNVTSPFHLTNDVIPGYDLNMSTSMLNSMRRLNYMVKASSFIKPDDPLNKDMMSNMLTSLHLLSLAVDDTLDAVVRDTQKFTSIAPYFYAFGWGVLIIVMIPLNYIGFLSLKNEIAYLFLLYLTIPRTTINKMIDIGNANPKLDRRALTLVTTTSIAQTTTKTGLLDDRTEADEQENVADGFKMLVSDSGGGANHVSVLPRYFVTKTSILFFFVTGVTAVFACVCMYMYTSLADEVTRSFYTQKWTCRRSVFASVLMHGVTSLSDYPALTLEKYLKDMINIHSALLYSSEDWNISSKAFDDPDVVQAQSGMECSDPNNMSCQSMLVLFDIFLNSITNAVELFVGGQQDKVNKTEILETRRMYNDILIAKMKTLNDVTYEYCKTAIRNGRNTVIGILIIAVVFLILMLSLTVPPILDELAQMVESVKMPMKHIPPLELTDLPKLMQYLQGECDYKRGTHSESSSEQQIGNHFLNAMVCPFAIFEEDFALLFANTAFYNLLGTTREAAVGLQIDEVFNPVLGFREKESHPFNSIMETIQQLRRGVSPVRAVEIRTEMDVPSHAGCPVNIRLVGICDSKDKNKEDDGGETVANDKGSSQMLKAEEYVFFITDLSHRRKIEEKLKHETETIQKLMDNAIPKTMVAALKVDDVLQPKVFHRLPMVSFLIREPEGSDDSDDDILSGCRVFMKNACDIVHTFGSVSRLQHSPPVWIYATGHNAEQEDLALHVSEIMNFALSMLELFSGSSETHCTLSACVHVGDVTILPLTLDLPTTETFGTGYRAVQWALKLTPSGLLYATQEAFEQIQNNPAFNIVPCKGIKKNAAGQQIPMYEVNRGQTEVLEDLQM